MNLAFYVPGELRNFANRKAGHWGVEARYREGWHQRTAAAFLLIRPRILLPAGLPKRVLFFCYTYNHFDSDGLANACKPIRDQLVKDAIIHADDRKSGHQFAYEYQIRRREMGVRVSVELLPGGKAHGS